MCAMLTSNADRANATFRSLGQFRPEQLGHCWHGWL